MKVPSVECGKQLHVGAGDPKALGTGTGLVRGSAYIEGPLQVGDDEAYDTITATVMIGTEQNTDTKEHPKESLHVKGNVKIEGDTDQTGDMEISGDMTIGGTMKAGYATWSGSIVATTKLFEIDHPTKPNKRLRHGCLEGPELGVYIRGRLTDDNRINLPEYWSKLVDLESITATLTSIGVGNQDLYVEKIEWGKTVIVKSGTGSKVDCYYLVQAERKDVDKLELEVDK